MFQSEKVKEILNVLEAGIAGDKQAVAQAAQELEGLILMMQPEEAAPPQIESETQGM